MIISLAAAPADFEQFQWYSNKGEPFIFKPGGDSRSMHVFKDDLIGFKQTKSGPSAGDYQVILAKAPHVIFRAVKASSIDEHMEKLQKYTGIPIKPTKTGERAQRIKIKGADAHDKHTALKYKPEKLPKEEGEYDKANYQWREVMQGPIPISTLHHKKTRTALKRGDIVGLRFWTSARGGFIIMPNGERVNISETTYENVTLGATILPNARQQVGIVVISDILSQLPKRARNVKPRAPKAEPEKVLEWEDEDEDETEKKAAKQGRRGKSFLDQHKDLVSDFNYADDDEEDEFEEDDEFEDEDDEDDLEFEDDSEENVNTEEGDEEIQYVEEGMIFQLANGKKLCVAGIEELEVSDMLYLYDMETGDIRKQAVPSGIDAHKIPKTKMIGRVKAEELENIKRRASKRMNR